MSVYIKGMEMPEHCMDCPFMVSRDNDDCILQSNEANEGFENWEQMKDGCPLVPVPSHGELIEKGYIIGGLKAARFLVTDETGLDLMERHIQNAPTIIPAEEGE